MYWSLIAGRPVPPITRTWVMITLGVFTRTNFSTVGESLVWAASDIESRTRAEASSLRMSASGKEEHSSCHEPSFKVSEMPGFKVSGFQVSTSGWLTFSQGAEGDRVA